MRPEMCILGDGSCFGADSSASPAEGLQVDALNGHSLLFWAMALLCSAVSWGCQWCPFNSSALS